MAFARRTSPLRFAASLAVIAFVSSAHAADFTIENVSVQQPDKKGTVTIKSIAVRGSNLSREEFMRMYDPATPKDESLALVKKLQAASISVPEVLLTRNDDKPGSITFKGYEIAGYDQGKFAKFAMAGMDGKFKPDADGGEVSVKAGNLLLEDCDFSKLLEAAAKGDLAESTTRIGKMNFRDFEVLYPEKSPAGPMIHTFRINSITANATYEGNLPLKSVAEVKGVAFIPAAKSGAATAMEQFGYKQVDAGIRGEGTYNPSSKSYDLTDFSLSGVNVGALSLKGLFGAVGPEAFNGGQTARLGALMASEISNLTLRYADNGLFDKALVFYANMNGKDPKAVRQEWAGMIAGVLPMVLGGDPGGLKLAAAVSDFVKAPKSLTISVKGKAGPVRVSDLQQIGDPTELVKRIDIEASANK